jgi:acetate---CoA ligase (ADP-forming)
MTSDPSSALERLLKPKTIAFVGLSDNGHFGSFVRPTLDSDAEIFMVNPKYDTVLGRPTVPSLSDIGKPVDAVMSLMSAERTTALAEEAATLDVGGLVLVTSGFAEDGENGAGLQARIQRAAASSGMAAIGPNGLGYINVRHRVSLTIASPHKRRPGGISVVSHSGALLSGVAMAAWQYDGSGLNVIASAGNEAVTDLADCVNYFTDDPETTAIGLIIEKIRRPDEFFAAVRRAAEAGKPVVALKLARNERSRKMAASHTAALTGDAWVYDVALRQAGVALAYDPEELFDRLALFDQIPVHRRTPVNKLAIVTMTGGFASLGLDIAADEGVTIPDLEEEFGPWIRENLNVTVPNPLDTTTIGNASRIFPEVLARYTASDSVDSLLNVHPTTDEDKDSGIRVVSELAKIADAVNKPIIAANCSGVPGTWAHEYTGALALGRGLRPAIRGLQTLGAFTAYRARLGVGCPVADAIPRPAVTPVAQPEGAMLPFGATMELLASHGIPVAPYALVARDSDVTDPGFEGPYVVKLADVAHRTEHGAVRLNVGRDDLGAAIKELRSLAADRGLSATIAIQPMVAAEGEALLGVQGESELGPLVVFGLGGIFAEALRTVGGRMAPFGLDEARALIEEFRDVQVMHGFRGRAAWDLEALASILVGASALAAGASDWIESLDINPLLATPTGFQAVDALLILKPPR